MKKVKAAAEVADQLCNDLKAFEIRLQEARTKAETHKQALQGLDGLGKDAMAEVTNLAREIEYLYDLERAVKKVRLGKLGDRATDVDTRKNKVAEQAGRVVSKLKELLTALTTLKPAAGEVWPQSV